MCRAAAAVWKRSSSSEIAEFGTRIDSSAIGLFAVTDMKVPGFATFYMAAAHRNADHPRMWHKSGKDARFRAPSPHHRTCGTAYGGSTAIVIGRLQKFDESVPAHTVFSTKAFYSYQPGSNQRPRSSWTSYSRNQLTMSLPSRSSTFNSARRGLDLTTSRVKVLVVTSIARSMS